MTGQVEAARAREVVAVQVAEAELLAVRELLAELQREVAAEQLAADEAERRAGHVASYLGPDLDPVERSQRIVVEMTAARQAGWRSSYERARVEAEARLAEASRRAADLAEATRREVAELLAARLPDPGSTPAAPIRSLPTPVTSSPVTSSSVTSPPVEPVAPPPAPDAPAFDEVFWREATSASAARAASFAPIEALLPTVALVIVLIAVLLLIG